ncbi:MULTISPECIES: bifunctional response regulator/alkaline phosphatase family protein [Chryseobacterium]|jgi:CheY-like chemotaxis protein|uniref:CheY-like chemotaxis protein n=1 Tax=Chryseobacterium sediminis TaxID=1679494 RepID=A0ABR6Q2E9_9FLAO|nr:MULTISPECIES: bifunctional response regulator/alkaline phosphatase family protein [Chryseobacterium]WPO92060.1 bifunctional response regulator/alkaline phosphatase family protein [Chryseobacterium sp. HR92]MBB6331472.1 CheY-like chemotaxis protein [Chryseobacterium sediminis]MCW1960912.1 bifunctional response regulator/alkaline phosphatase family protein [Chryseobacterium viscerum]MDR3026328.1 bifunctional response regulator/alkaline phosphatase family protein [Chryseobacterium sp.]UTX50621
MSEKILWIDDEIDLLKPHIVFLEKKGYQVTPVNNVNEALELMDSEKFALTLIDENMPGISGLEAIPMIKEKDNSLKIVMVTKSEEEHIMEEAIGSQIADYILKPVNPNQILLSLKKNLQEDNLVEQKTILQYQQEFRNLSMELSYLRTYQEWAEYYKKILSWEIKFDKVADNEFADLLQSQKEEANIQFAKFIEKNYTDWLVDSDKPLMSHTLFKEKVKPEVEKEKVLLLMVDNLRYDQWKVIEPLFTKYYNKISEDYYYSILPTATQYARNSFFAGLMPSEIEKRFPDKWFNDNEEGNKNEFERDFLEDQMKRIGLGSKSMKYLKVLNADFERKIYDDFNQHKNNDLLVIVYNFIDILSHAKTDNHIVDQLIRDDKTFRSLTFNWFENSSLLKIIKTAAENGYKLVITTDHGTVYVKKPSKVVGDRETSTNIRYKTGKSLTYDDSDVWAITNPEKLFLPKGNLSSKYIFAKNNIFLAYPKNYNHFVNYYKETYQHGGISLEECIIPISILEPK